MLDRAERVVGEEFRGAVQTGDRYLAQSDGHAFGYVDCARSIAARCTAARDLRSHGLGRAMITALMQRPELRFVELFEAGVEPENVASGRCLDAAGCRVRSQQPDCEGMLYYTARRADVDPNAKLLT